MSVARITQVEVIGGDSAGIYEGDSIANLNEKREQLRFLASELVRSHWAGRKFRFDDGSTVKEFDREGISSVIITFENE
jgi:hypothetical protein